MEKILITGGAGFVGSNLALLFKTDLPKSHLVCFDNLRRRGSELALSRLKDHGINFVHGDVRMKDDLLELGDFDLIIDCSAEPSVIAGVNGSPNYVFQTNLNGTLNCLELARRGKSIVIFLSTSRVYPYNTINSLKFQEAETRFTISDKQSVKGVSNRGISEEFPLEGVRSFYGASKFASELILQEYLAAYNLQGIINRCGILTGPWQMGKVDQGIVVHWIASHIYNKELAYFGYSGSGKQVRDILHVADLFDLLLEQLNIINSISGKLYNVGGGSELSLSLKELTVLCQENSGRQIQIREYKEDRPNDLIWYVSDCRKIQKKVSWRPKYNCRKIIAEISNWIRANELVLAPILS